ncbi:hypothetical protein ACXVUM_11435 [Williamsia sp. SKLECPSW1]
MGSPPQGPPQGWGPPPQGPPPGWGPPPGPPQGPPPGWGPPPQGPPPGWGPPPWGADGSGPPPSGGRGSGKAIAVIVGVVVALVAVVVVLGVVVLRNSGDDGSPIAAGASTSSEASTDNGPASSQPPSSQPPSSAGAAACPPATRSSTTPAGWKTVAGKRGLAYDVPPSWDVLSCSSLVGWERKCDDGPFGYCPIRTMSGAASLESARCPDSSLAVAGLPGAASTTNIDIAVRDESALVKDIYTSDSGQVPSVSLSPPRRFTVGGAPAVQVVAAVTGIEPSACQGTSALHSMVATTVPGQPGSVLFVISLPQGVPGAVAPADADRMVDSLRRAR